MHYCKPRLGGGGSVVVAVAAAAAAFGAVCTECASSISAIIGSAPTRVRIVVVVGVRVVCCVGRDVYY